MRSLEEIRRTPVGLLSEEEIAQLDPACQAIVRNFQARREKCRHCGKDMTIDSSD